MGTLTRFPGIIPSTSPDPVKMSTAISSTSRRAASPLFGVEEARESRGDGYDGPAGLQDDDDIGIPDDDWIIDDLGDGMEDKPLVNGHGAREMGKPVEICCNSNRFNIIFTVNVTKAQPAFQPGATPFINQRRYLGMASPNVVRNDHEHERNFSS